MEGESLIQTIIQGGGIGVAVLMILYSGWKDKAYNKTLNNHLHEVADALKMIAGAMGRNSEVLGRVERKLDNK